MKPNIVAWTALIAAGMLTFMFVGMKIAFVLGVVALGIVVIIVSVVLAASLTYKEGEEIDETRDRQS